MYIYGAKFQEHCFNISRDIVYSVFYHFQLQTIWRHHWSNLHNRKTSISLKLREIFQKEKRHSSVFWKAFQISRKNFSCHMHFKPYCWSGQNPNYSDTLSKPGYKSNILVISFNFCHSFMTSINLYATSTFFMLDNELQRTICTYKHNLTCMAKFKITLQVTPKIYK